MKTEILITGDEIRTGAVTDTNSPHIAQAMEEIGLEVVRHNCVGDDKDHLVSIIQEIGSRSDVAVVTGGLGPTPDDITAEAAAKSAGVECVLNRSALRSIEDYFKTRKRPIIPLNKKQAMLPKGAQLLPNSVGTAPGFLLKIGRCIFFFLPGVPFEMRRMLSDWVLPRIKELQGGKAESTMVQTLLTFGLTESAAAEQLKGFETRHPGIKLGFRAEFPVIQIKLYGRGGAGESFHQRMAEAAESVIKKLGKNVVSIDGSPMETEVGRLLTENKATLAVAESCTGGLISHMLTNVPGSSNYFLLSSVTYSNESKIKMLGVSSEVIEQYGAVHEKTAKKMAEGVRRLAGSTYGLATSGIAGPDGGTDDKPVGTVCIGLSGKDSVQGFRFFFPFNSRERNKKIFAVKALDLLRRELHGM